MVCSVVDETALPSHKVVLLDKKEKSITLFSNLVNAPKVIIEFIQHGERPASENLRTLFLGGEIDLVLVSVDSDSGYEKLSRSDFWGSLQPVLSRYESVYAHGDGEGGRAALYFGGIIDAKILALSPSNIGDEHSRLEDGPKSTHPPVIVYDPTVGVDRDFVERHILPVYDRAELVELRYAGHDISRYLEKNKVLAQCLINFVEFGSFPDSIIHVRQDWVGFRQRGIEAFRYGSLFLAEIYFRKSLELNFQKMTVRLLARTLSLRKDIDGYRVLETEALERLSLSGLAAPDWVPFPSSWVRKDAPALRSSMHAEEMQNRFNVKERVPSGGKETIASQPGYLITLHRSKASSKVLLISFDGITGTLREKGFGSQFALKNGYDHLFVAQAEGTQYQRLSIESFRAAVMPIASNYDRVVTYGNSLGGYCALYYGGVIGAQIIAGAPKNSAHPLIRRASLGDLAFTHREIADNPKSPLDPVILFDPRRSGDKLVIEKLVRPAYPNAKYIELPFAGHTVLQTMQHSGVLKQFMTELIENDVIGKIDLKTHGSSIWHREFGRSLVYAESWSEAEYHLRESLALEEHKYTLQFLALVLDATGRNQELRELVQSAYRTYGKKWYSPYFREIQGFGD